MTDNQTFFIIMLVQSRQALSLATIMKTIYWLDFPSKFEEYLDLVADKIRGLDWRTNYKSSLFMVHISPISILSFQSTCRFVN